MTSKGKSMFPSRKLEKQLKRAIRDFQLAADMFEFDTLAQDAKADCLQFRDWFRVGVVETYSTQIPSTI